MNACFYTAIDRLPLGTVAAIAFLPVILLAALGARTPRNAGALALTVPAVYLLTGRQLAMQPLGPAFAVASAGDRDGHRVVVLTQVPSPAEVAGVALVVAGVALHRAPPEPAAPYPPSTSRT